MNSEELTTIYSICLTPIMLEKNCANAKSALGDGAGSVVAAQQ